MKQEWKPDEMRANAEEIRSAVMPKSVTPEMVGGTLLGLVNAVGEVVEVLGEIPREHVTVKVRGYDGIEGVSGAGATVKLDVFHVKSFPITVIPRQELIADENGIVEFDVPYGFKYAVFSQLDGLGASFQMVELASSTHRTITLWNLPVGISHLYKVFSDYNRLYPRTLGDYAEDIDWDSENDMVAWGWDLNQEEDECLAYIEYCGILISSADTSFVIGENSHSDFMNWCDGADVGKDITGLQTVDVRDEHGVVVDRLVSKQRSVARKDFNGNLNTEIILDSAINPIAVEYCVKSTKYMEERRFLPSLGQLYLISVNVSTINKCIKDASQFGISIPQFPTGSFYPNGMVEYWWSSTMAGGTYSWVQNEGSSYPYPAFSNIHSVRSVSIVRFSN